MALNMRAGGPPMKIFSQAALDQAIRRDDDESLHLFDCQCNPHVLSSYLWMRYIPQVCRAPACRLCVDQGQGYEMTAIFGPAFQDWQLERVGTLCLHSNTGLDCVA